jgi:hypothetical protein
MTDEEDSTVEFALPHYLMRDLMSLTDTLNNVQFETDYLYVKFEELNVYFGDDETPSGRIIRGHDGEFIVTLNAETLKAVTEGEIS